ncbi:MAG TPA: prepilin-type N-terminal cleavage/methylation domain-containing protein [Syntrophales bacterium]|nr:prepilin-type N-terminal cleavage/methylation domain-containing protein [Syntrophales bacterium]
MPTLETGICNNKAFTLLELVVIIFILSLVIAVSFPFFPLQEDGKLKSEAGHIASILRYLSDSAISTKDTYAVNINFKEKTLSYKGPEGERVEKIDNLTQVTTQSKGSVSDGEVTVLLRPAGTGENFSIRLTGSELSMEIVFNALSGRVKVLSNESI